MKNLIGKVMGIILPNRPKEPSPLMPSKQAYGMIKAFEGLRLEAYRDLIGVWTIGYGTTGPDVKEGLKITAEEAYKRLTDQVDWLASRLRFIVPKTLNQNQFDAILSFCYNLGIGAYKYSTMKKFVDSGEFIEASKEFDKWVFAGGKSIPGLVRRREAERVLFLKPA